MEWRVSQVARVSRPRAGTQVDSVVSVKGRLPAWYLLEEAERILTFLEHEHRQRVQCGALPANVVFQKPHLCHAWLRRWRRAYHVTWRTATLRLKCSKETCCRRLLAFWQNVLRLRFLVAELHPGVVLHWTDADQKPIWFTSAGDMPTLSFRGNRQVCVKESVPGTRERFTMMTR